MAKLSLCGGRAAVTAGSRLLASGLGAVAGGERYTNNFFLYDCSSAEKKLPDHKESVARRCTALVITTAEDRIFVADKSGDVYSFSVTDPQGEARLELGHLSMLLHLAVSPDDQYIITADRDEKVRVSLLAAPHNIVSFCLGHTETKPSSFGNVTGREVQSCDLSTSHRQDGDEDKRFAVSRIAASCSGSHIAVLFDCVPTVHVFQFDAASRQLLPGQEISLEHGVWDVAFDASSGLWILQEDKDEVVLIYRLADGKWQRSLNEESMERLSNHLRDNWTLMEGCSDTESPFRNLYKASYDNMAHYLQKKEERILEQKQKKRKGAQQETTQQTKVLHPVTPSS